MTSTSTRTTLDDLPRARVLADSRQAAAADADQAFDKHIDAAWAEHVRKDREKHDR